MYFDIEDYRPDTPRSPSVISVREGVLLSIIVHLGLVIAFLLMPKSFFETAQRLLPVPHDPVKFITIAPPVPSERNTTREQPPKAENPEPFSRGTTPEKVLGAPTERPAGPDKPQPADPQPASKPLPDLTSKVLPDLPEPPQKNSNTSGGKLGDQLRNLQRYLQDNNDNDRGGQTDKAPDIQFDPKGIDFGPWLQRFKLQVMSNWSVPQ